LKPGWSRGPCGLALNILDPVRLALPRPPNLESQYRRVRKSCQEKKACTSQNVVGVLKTRSICSGVISHTELFFFLRFGIRPQKFREHALSKTRKLVLALQMSNFSSRNGMI
jgi:hypothetical protein